MLVGIMSDSHGRQRAVRAALALFDARGVSHVVHCGDVGGQVVFDELVGRSVTFVWGNTDVPSGGLLAYLATVGVRPPRSVPETLRLDGKTLAVYHGHEPGFDEAVRGTRFDYLLHGHTHERRDERSGRMRVINPGALHRASPHTVAVLDTAADALEFLTVAGT
jgi:putative phosphoesterase